MIFLGKSVFLWENVLILPYKSTGGVRMRNLIGEYRVKIDSKGRIKLPKDLLRQLDLETALPLVVNRGYEKHLMLYPRNVWEEKTKEINKLNINISKGRQAIRYFNRGAKELFPDTADRILIPKTLINYAGLQKEVVLFAYNTQIEVWDADAYEELLQNEPENFSEILDSLYRAEDNVPRNE